MAHNFRAHQKTIERLVRKSLATGTVKVCRVLRLRVTTAAEDRAIRTAHLRRRFQTAAATSTRWVSGHVIGRHTVRRRLRNGGILCKRPINGYGLQQRQRASRLAWATHHVRWTQQHLQTVVICDESPFPVTKRDARQRVYRRQDERLAPNCIRYKGDKRYAHVWGTVGCHQLVLKKPVAFHPW